MLLGILEFLFMHYLINVFGVINGGIEGDICVNPSVSNDCVPIYNNT
jgi:hypothetical protein